jgi:hypothetical protein
MPSSRRTFLKQAAIATAAAAASGRSNVAHAAQPPARALDPTLLAALGNIVLPESLGAAGRARAIHSFTQWLAGYKPVSEEMHGYGNQEITYTAADPAPGWNAQLEGIELLARRKHARGFAALDLATRRELVRSQLARQRGATLPSNPLAAPHVAISLLTHWANSSEATDLVYGVRIAKGNCRQLAESPRKPLPLAGPGRE